MALTVIIAYDITADRRRTRMATLLQGWGYRIQDSVFQLRLEGDGLDKVRAGIEKIIRPTEDVVHIYPLCASCRDRAETHGIAVALDEVGLYHGVW